MSFITKISSKLRFWTGGPLLRNVSGVIEARNAADSAYAIVRGGTPSGNNDLGTKNYVDTLAATNQLSNVESRIVSLTYTNTGNNNLGAVVPAGANVIAAFVQVTTLFNGTTPVLKIGDAGTSDSVLGTAENTLTTAGLYSKAQITNFVTATQLLANLTIGGSPSQGVCKIVVLFSRAAS